MTRLAHLAALALCGLTAWASTPALAQPHPVLDGANANAFGLQGALGEVVDSWRFGAATDKTLAVEPDGAGGLQVRWGAVLSSALTALAGVPDAGVLVLVNHGLGSWPTPSNDPDQHQIAPFSVTGLAYPTDPDPTVVEPLAVTFDPPPGTYPGPLAVTVRMTGGTGSPVRLQVANAAAVDVGLREATVLLNPSQDGQVLTLSVQATRGAGTATASASYTFTLPTTFGDRDRDGVPDPVEAAAGMDPEAPDADLDSDGDGWSNLDELLRGCSPENVLTASITPDPNCTCTSLPAPSPYSVCSPADGDGDGWANLDEGWRGTDPNDADSRPLASGRYGPELRLTARPRTGVGVVNANDGALELRELGGELHPTRAVSGYPHGFAINQPPSTTFPPVALSTEPTLRLASHVPAILRARQWTATSPREGLPWSVAALTPVGRGFLPTEVMAALEAADLPRSSVADWLDGARALMSQRLVSDHTLTLDPASTRALALLESLASWHADSDLDTTALPADHLAPVVVFTPEGAGDQSRDAFSALASAYAATLATPTAPAPPTWEALGALYAALATLAADAPELASLRAATTTLETAALGGATTWAALVPTPTDTLPTPAATFDTELARRVARQPDLAVARLAARVQAYLGPTRLAAAAAATVTALRDPAADVDSDLADHATELAGPARFATDPLDPDTDADGALDGEDPCPTDPTDACWAASAFDLDKDGDTIPDGLDNCPAVANGPPVAPATSPAAQLDTDGDGVGDACDTGAWIASPRTHVRTFTGTSIPVEAALDASVPANIHPCLEVAWTFDGGGADLTSTWDTGAWRPSPLRFDAPGTYLVTLTVTETCFNGGTATDSRWIEVRDPPTPGPEATIAGPATLVEGLTGTFTATASSGNPGPLTYAWAFGDGATAGGASASHAFAAEGTYSVALTVTDAAGQSATVTFGVAVTDSAPSPSFGDAASGYDLERTLSDTSTAYDGVASVTWNIAGVGTFTGSPLTAAFPTPGTWSVTLTVVDGDGTSASVTQDVEVTGSGLEVLAGTLTTTWQAFAFARPMFDPVVVHGPPTAADPTPAVVALRNLTPTGFEARLQPWAYLPGAHGPESVAFLAMERGEHRRRDGTRWVAGRTPISTAWTAVSFPSLLPAKPAILASVFALSAPVPVTVRARDVARAGFDLRLVTEQAQTVTATEVVAWIALIGNSGAIPVNGAPTAWDAYSVNLDEVLRVRHGVPLRLQEEQSADPEVKHQNEATSLIVLDTTPPRAFAMTRTEREVDPFVIVRGP